MNKEIQFILYHLPDEEGKVQVVIKDETIWATQKAMAQLFGVDKSGISRHIVRPVVLNSMTMQLLRS